MRICFVYAVLPQHCFIGQKSRSYAITWVVCLYCYDLSTQSLFGHVLVVVSVALDEAAHVDRIRWSTMVVVQCTESARTEFKRGREE
jgi:hypothetical protein